MKIESRILKRLKRIFKGFYWKLFLHFILLSLIGVFYIYSASMGSFYVYKQLFWLMIGIVVILFVNYVGYKKFLDFAYVIYIFSLALLVLVFFIGTGKYGAQRWIPVFGFALQPSEFAKIAVILALARYMGNREKTIRQKKSFVASFFIVLLPLILIVKQPDLGTSLVFLPILFSMLYLWGAKLKYIMITFSMGIVSLPFIWNMLKPYQKKRLITFINPNADPMGSGYTAIQSKIAVGSGMLTGKGFMCGTQNRLNFVPEHHTDFIFCVIAEEGGFLMSAVLILLFLFMFLFSIDVARSTTDSEAKLFAVGVTTMFVVQTFINIGMAIGICPITGLPLPLISYGGSSMLVFAFAFGMLISIYKERTIF